MRAPSTSTGTTGILRVSAAPISIATKSAGLSMPGFVLRSQPVWTDDGQHGIACSYLAIQVFLEVSPDRDVVDIHKQLMAAKRRGE
jgi:hypothetical protein